MSAIFRIYGDDLDTQICPNCDSKLMQIDPAHAICGRCAAAELAALEAAVQTARELLTTLEWNDWDDRVDAWLAAHPAPDAPDEVVYVNGYIDAPGSPTMTEPQASAFDVAETLLDEWHK
jgi:hypothetical protein